MSRLPDLNRWSGPASILGAALLVAQISLHSTLGPDQDASNPYEVYEPLLYVVYNLLFDAALLLFVVGLVGLYDRRVERFAWLGKAGLLLALSAGASAAANIALTLLEGLLWTGGFAPLTFFTRLLAIFGIISGAVFLGIATMRSGVSRERLFRARRREVFLILVAGLGAALLSDVIENIMNGSYLGLKGNHLLHVLVTIPVAVWVTRKIGTAPVLCGLLVGVASGIINQIFNHAILHPGTLTWYEVVVIMLSCIGAGWLGGIITRATLLDQETLYRASQAIGEASSPQGLVDAVGEHLTDPRVSHVVLWQDVSEDDDVSVELSLRAGWMPREAQVWGHGVWRPGLRLDASRVPALANLRRQSPLILRVRKLPVPERAAWEHQGIRSAILVPLTSSSGARVGVLMVASQSIYGFSRVKVRTYLTIGAQVTLALENSRLVQHAQQSGVLDERQRLAREIHDTLAQSFSSIVLNLEAAEGTLSHDPESAQQFLDQARSTARESLVEARRLMWALRPESLDRAPLPEALSRLAERWSGECDTDAGAAVTGTPYPLPPEVEVTLLRMAQEALTNCRKYAQASRVAITLSYMNNLVALNVQDDGVGFDTNRRSVESDGQEKGGFGLKGMRERIEKFRGTLLVESAPGEGTTLMVAIPVAMGGRAAEGAEVVKTVRGETS